MPIKISERSQMVNVVLPNGIINLVERYCAKTGITISGFVRSSVIKKLEDLSIISTEIKRVDNHAKIC